MVSKASRAQSSHSSSRSSSSGGPKPSCRSRDGHATRTKTNRLPDTSVAVNCLKYFTGRRPSHITGVKIYETTYADYDDDGSSARSGWSFSSGRKRRHVQIVLLENRQPQHEDDQKLDNEVLVAKHKVTRVHRNAVAADSRPPRGVSRASAHTSGEFDDNDGMNYDDDDNNDDDDLEGEVDNGRGFDHGPVPPPPPPPPLPHMGPGAMPPPGFAGRDPPGAFPARYPSGPGPTGFPPPAPPRMGYSQPPPPTWLRPPPPGFAH